jgi:hypothetical protein
MQEGGARPALNHTSIKTLGLGLIFLLLPTFKSFGLDVLLRTIYPCCHSQQECHGQCIRDQCVYIMRSRVGYI